MYISAEVKAAKKCFERIPTLTLPESELSQLWGAYGETQEEQFDQVAFLVSRYYQCLCLHALTFSLFDTIARGPLLDRAAESLCVDAERGDSLPCELPGQRRVPRLLPERGRGLHPVRDVPQGRRGEVPPRYGPWLHIPTCQRCAPWRYLGRGKKLFTNIIFC